MPVTIQCDNFLLELRAVEGLWRETINECRHADDEVTVRCVSEADILKLNIKYRKLRSSTNVLTFSYEGEHDIAICLSVAEREAKRWEVAVRDYMALLLVHAFLHAMGMDHERSAKDAMEMIQAEKKILSRAGFVVDGLVDLNLG